MKTFTIPQKWEDLNDYQLGKICKIWHNVAKSGRLEFSEQCNLMQALVMKSASFKELRKSRSFFKEVPPAHWHQYLKFLFDEQLPNLGKFPKIKTHKGDKSRIKRYFNQRTLVPPADRLSNLTVEQFEATDAIFYRWKTKGDIVYLKRLVSFLYTFDGTFSKKKVVQVGNYVSELSEEKLYHIGFIYFLSYQNRIVNQYRKIYPKPKEKVAGPVFSKRAYTPFNDLTKAMAFNDPQPLGDYEQVKKTNIYTFLNLMTESLERHEALKNSI